MTPKEANDVVVRALADAEVATRKYTFAVMARDEALAWLKRASEDLEDVLRAEAGLDVRPDRREEYLRLYTFK